MCQMQEQAHVDISLPNSAIAHPAPCERPPSLISHAYTQLACVMVVPGDLLAVVPLARDGADLVTCERSQVTGSNRYNRGGRISSTSYKEDRDPRDKMSNAAGDDSCVRHLPWHIAQVTNKDSDCVARRQGCHGASAVGGEGGR